MAQGDTKLNPGIAAVLSFFFSGLGQIYNGQLKKGLILIFFSGLNILLFLLGAVLIGYWLLFETNVNRALIAGIILACLGLISICIVGIYSLIDAYKVAKK